MSLDEAVKKYSKKWGVSPEEAEKKIKQMLEQEGRERTIPTVEDLFPEPLGPVSKKIQDVNQALLSTAYTRRLLNTPPEDVAALRERIERVDQIVGDLKGGLQDQIQKLTETLEDKKRKEAREELLKELDSKMDPLREGLKSLTEKLEGVEKGGEDGPAEPEKIVEQAEKVVDATKNWLKRRGYKVEAERVSKEEVQKMIEDAQKEALANLPPEELKKRLEQAGYKIVGGPLSYEQVQKLVEEAKRRAQEDALEDKRIEAVQNIIRDSVGRIIGMFQPAVETWMRYSLESRRAGRAPPKEGGGGKTE